jgi:hypothetical protein
LVLSACSASLNGGALNQEGIYECKSELFEDAPVYRFDTADERTSLHAGTDIPYIDFFDMISRKMVRLHEDNFQYKCKCTEPDITN